MTTIKVTTKFGRWDEAAEQLNRAGLTLTIHNTVEAKHGNGEIVEAILEIFTLVSAGVLAGFSIGEEDIRAD